MKKSVKIFAALAIVAVVFSGCITATVLMTKWAVDEEKEIVGGKVFEESTGTVFYSYNGYTEGMKLTFKDNGKYIHITKPNSGDFTIITPDDVYQGNTKDKTYVHKKNTSGTYYYSDISMVFPVEWFRWEKFADDMVDNTNKSEGSEYIVDKKCVTFTDDHNYKVAGYKRIYMYKKVNGVVKFVATRWKQGSDSDFKVPSDCKEVSGSIDYSENF